MSKFSEVLRLVDTRQRVALMPALRITEQYDQDKYILPNAELCASVYEMTATWGCRTVFTEAEYRSYDIRKFKEDHAKRMLVEEMFGEFRMPIDKARVALMNYDYKAAEEHMLALYKGMFNV